MKLAVMQPYLFPYIGYFQLLNVVDKFIIYDDVNYINRGWINRNSILLNGLEHKFTVPIHKASQNKLINELEFGFDDKWVNKFVKTINNAYVSLENYDKLIEIIDCCFKYPSKNVSEFIYNSFIQINKYLEIETEIVRSSSIYNNNKLKGQERIIDICLKEKADIYINPVGGQKLYDNEKFKQNGIKLFFINNLLDNIVVNNQVVFNTHLSIIHSIVSTKKEDLKNLILNSYKLLQT